MKNWLPWAGVALLLSLVCAGFFAWGYHEGANSPCNEVLETEIMPTHPK